MELDEAISELQNYVVMVEYYHHLIENADLNSKNKDELDQMNYNIGIAWLEYFEKRSQIFRRFYLTVPNHSFFNMESMRPIREKFDNAQLKLDRHIRAVAEAEAINSTNDNSMDTS